MAKVPTDLTESADSEDDEEMSLDVQGLLRTLLKWSWLAVLAAVLAGLAAWSFTRRLPTLYQSVATIQIEAREQKAIDLRDDSQNNLQSPEGVETIIQNFGSRSFLERVNKSLGLAKDPAFLGYTPVEPASDDLVAALLLGGTRAALRPRTRLIDVVFVHENPKVAYKVANALVEQFIQQGVDQRSSMLETQNRVLVEKSQELKEKVNRSELALQDYKTKLASVSIEDRRNLVEEKLKGLNADLTGAKAERLRLESDTNQVNAARGHLDRLLTIPTVMLDPQVTAARDKQHKDEEELATLMQRYGPEHPRLIEQKAQVAAAQTAAKEAVMTAPDRLSSRFTAARAQEAGLQHAVDEQEAALLEMDAKVIPYRALQREYDSDRALFESVLQRLKESTLQLGVQAVEFHVADAATTARQVPSRRPLLVAAAALMGAAFVGVLIAGFFFVNQPVGTVDSVERLLGLPVLAAVPKMRQSRTPADVLATMNQPESIAAESFRTLRSSLLLLNGQDHQVILVTSAVPGEGKSVSAGNIAISFAQLGLRTLLVEADLRRPSLAGTFLPTGTETLGVGDYLQGSTIHIEPTKQEHLFFLSAGRHLRNPAESLSSGGFDQMIAQLKPDYQRIIIDTAPVDVISDTLNIVSCASVVCFVVRSNSTTQKIVKRAVELLRRSGVRPDGIILNWASPRRGRGYQEYYRAGANYGNNKPIEAAQNRQAITRPRMVADGPAVESAS